MRSRLVPFLAVTLATALVGLAACSNEGEGQPCSIDNGNNDCDDNLQCVRPPNSAATNASAVCCPLPGQAPTTPQCTLSGSVDSGSTSAPDSSTFPDTSTPVDGGTEAHASDGATEAATDSGSSSTDAASDAGPG